MSRQLAISSVLSVLAMASFALLGVSGTAQPDRAPAQASAAAPILPTFAR